jgi:Ca-activated chloride channel family protein
MFGDLFAHPWVLLFLLLVPVLGLLYRRRAKKMVSEVTFSSLQPFDHTPKSLRERLRHTPVALRMIALACFVIALARPQSVSSRENVSAEGIDIVLLLDISGSMLAEDFTPNRIGAAKQVAEEFIDGRTNDRIGLVIFAAESFTQCPLTTDYPVLKSLLKEVRNGMITDGTAIGLAIANGVNRLKDSDSKSKVMILLTDGVNNRGEIDPITAAKLAATYGIRVYTVGVGAIGQAPYPVETPFGIQRQLMQVDIDEKTLTTVADITGGKYFRATDNRTLRSIYHDIDQLEKTKIEVSAYRRYRELFYGWLAGGLIVLFIEIGLGATVLRKIP